jgi:hypothetical protein
MRVHRFVGFVLFLLLEANVLGAGISTTPYYDNRKAAVVWTADDLLTGRGPLFWAAAELARTNGMVISIGIITREMTTQLWTEMQSQMNRGYVVPVNHSYSHKVPQDLNWYTTNMFQEVDLSTAAIKSQIALPWQSTYAGNEFLVGWVQPYGELPEPYATEMRTQLVAHHYLVSRWIFGPRDFTQWAGDGMYGNVGVGINAVTENPSAVFDGIYATNGICHIYSHPWNTAGNVTNGTKWIDLMAHVGNRKDVWYVGFDHLYMYHYLQDQVAPVMTLVTNSADELVYSLSASSVEREKYGLSYPITYKVTVPTNWSAAKVLYSDADTPGGVVMAEKTTNDFFNGENVYRNDLANHAVYVSQAFPQQYNEFQIKLINTTDMSSMDTDSDGFDDEFEILNGLDRFKDQSAIISYVRNKPQQFGLYSEEDVGFISIEDVVLKVSNDTLRLKLQLEQSPDLVTWTNYGSVVEWDAVPDADKMFFRVRGRKSP